MTTSQTQSFGFDPPLVINHPDIASYLQWLLDTKSINKIEFERLHQAIAPLRAIMPSLTTIAAVKREIQISGLPLEDFSLMESSDHWQKQPLPIPGFDLSLAIKLFYVTVETDPTKHVSFLFHPTGPASEQRYIPPKLEAGDFHLFIILRMFRLQFDLNQARGLT